MAVQLFGSKKFPISGGVVYNQKNDINCLARSWNSYSKKERNKYKKHSDDDDEDDNDHD
jgi:hypothetical protein